jgi:hypothetical protein
MGFSGVFGSRPVASGGVGSLETVARNSTISLTTANMNQHHYSTLSSADITVTLPAAGTLSAYDGQEIAFTNDLTSTFNVIVEGNTSDPIYNQGYSNASLTLAPGDSVTLRFDDLNNVWHVSHDGQRGPWAIVGHSGSDQGMTTGSYILMPFNEVLTGNDPYGIVDTSASNYDITPGQLGEYDVIVAPAADFGGYSIQNGAALYKNGVEERKLWTGETFDNMLIPSTITVEVDSITDYFDVRVKGPTGQNFGDFTFEPYFEMRRRK